MFNILHAYHPSPILISLGPVNPVRNFCGALDPGKFILNCDLIATKLQNIISNGVNIYWYGFFIVLGILAAFLIILQLAKYYNISREIIFDLTFYLIIFGIIGARLYHVLLELPYYLAHPLNIFKVWQGGLAIHGAIIAGVITVWVFARKNFWFLAAIIAPGLALAQAIGRWGNYFNQELFGRPTNLPWSIPINIINRPLEYISAEYFHPTFLYESFGNLLIFLTLITIHIWIIKKQKFNNFCYLLSVICYLVLYSILRFATEFIRIDETPIIYGVRLPQIASVLIIIASIIVLLKNKKGRANITTTT
ncbi:prolipoprotein diacylglyceryl transferase [Candidatus Falkowbacteria bacterium]|nr:prolipoprotein diacylglyceryl transferase [Candidatus Falkowbacteria bacterium]